MNINVEKIKVGKLKTNCYVAYLEKEQNKQENVKKDILKDNIYSNVGFVVDPSFDVDAILEFVKEKNIDVKMILITHAHFDHVFEINEFQTEMEKILKHKVPILIHNKAKIVLNDKRQNLIKEFTGIDKKIRIDRYLKDGEKIKFYDTYIKVLYIGGHTIDSCCYYLGNYDVLFSGDSLFWNSIGRTDLYNSSLEQELKNIRKKLIILPLNTIVYPGHGKHTTIKHEKETNSFIRNR